jgi:hypothetical protein
MAADADADADVADMGADADGRTSAERDALTVTGDVTTRDDASPMALPALPALPAAAMPVAGPGAGEGPRAAAATGRDAPAVAEPATRAPLPSVPTACDAAAPAVAASPPVDRPVGSNSSRTRIRDCS